MDLKQRFLALPPVTKNLLIINTLIYLAMSLIPRIGDYFDTYGALYYFTSDNFLPMQLVTYMFLHGSFMHLFFNMFSLWMFGGIIERTLGSARFLLFYLGCGIGAALIQEGIFALMINHYAGLFTNGDALCHLLRNSTVMTSSIYDLGIFPDDPAVMSIYGLYHTQTVGASGAIYGILLAFGFLFPYMQIFLLFPPIPMKARTAVIVFAVIELALGIYNSQADTVAHFAHLGGMLVGFLLLLWWKKKGQLPRFY